MYYQIYTFSNDFNDEEMLTFVYQETLVSRNFNTRVLIQL